MELPPELLRAVALSAAYSLSNKLLLLPGGHQPAAGGAVRAAGSPPRVPQPRQLGYDARARGIRLAKRNALVYLQRQVCGQVPVSGNHAHHRLLLHAVGIRVHLQGVPVLARGNRPVACACPGPLPPPRKAGKVPMGTQPCSNTGYLDAPLRCTATCMSLNTCVAQVWSLC